MERKIPTKPVRSEMSDEAAARFIRGAPDAAASDAAGQASAAQADPGVPLALRKRKAPVTMTLDPAILAEFDQVAARMGLSRAAATGLAMKRMIDEEKKK
jgi:hypothetical protein